MSQLTPHVGINLDFDTEVLLLWLYFMHYTKFYFMSTNDEKLTKPNSWNNKKFWAEILILKIIFLERIWANSRDGKAKFRFLLVYHKTPKNLAETRSGIYGYGSYMELWMRVFNVRLSILDRGFIYAIAHIRGGRISRKRLVWQRKMLKKRKILFWFYWCCKILISENYTSPKHLYAMGGSAGGLLMGAIMNYEPEIFNGIVAQVPFL